jgi:hypothetical protein
MQGRDRSERRATHVRGQSTGHEELDRDRHNTVTRMLAFSQNHDPVARRVPDHGSPSYRSPHARHAITAAITLATTITQDDQERHLEFLSETVARTKEATDSMLAPMRSPAIMLSSPCAQSFRHAVSPKARAIRTSTADATLGAIMVMTLAGGANRPSLNALRQLDPLVGRCPRSLFRPSAAEECPPPHEHSQKPPSRLHRRSMVEGARPLVKAHRSPQEVARKHAVAREHREGGPVEPGPPTSREDS